jgi:hypothetical protein
MFSKPPPKKEKEADDSGSDTETQSEEDEDTVSFLVSHQFQKNTPKFVYLLSGIDRKSKPIAVHDQLVYEKGYCRNCREG